MDAREGSLPDRHRGTMPAPLFERMRPRVEVGSLVARSFEVWWKNLWRLSLVALLVYVPLLAAFAIQGVTPGEGVATPALVVGGLGTAFAALAALAATTYAAVQHLSGKRARLGAMLAVGARRALPVVAVGLLAALAVLGGFLLLVVPGVIVFCGLVVAIPAAVVERPGLLGALRRSWALTRERRFTIFVVLLVFWLLSSVANGFVTVLVAVLPQGPAVLGATGLSLAVGLLFSSLQAVVPAVAYHDLRVEKEGVDAAELAGVFE
jgi:MFS family permease